MAQSSVGIREALIMRAVSFDGPSWSECSERILERQSWSIAFATTFGLDTVGASRSLLSTLDASLATCYRQLAVQHSSRSGSTTY